MEKLTQRQKIAQITRHFSDIMQVLGLNRKDPAISDTPERVAKMYVNELCLALSTPPPKLTTFPNEGYDQIVLIKDITFYSLCEHHWVPIHGKCHIAYLPGDRVLGLSKFARVVKYFAAKPQLQERHTQEVFNFLCNRLKTQNVAVYMEASHYCCSMRGVKDPNMTTVTSALGGIFEEATARGEFLSLIKT